MDREFHLIRFDELFLMIVFGDINHYFVFEPHWTSFLNL